MIVVMWVRNTVLIGYNSVNTILLCICVSFKNIYINIIYVISIYNNLVYQFTVVMVYKSSQPIKLISRYTLKQKNVKTVPQTSQN